MYEDVFFLELYSLSLLFCKPRYFSCCACQQCGLWDKFFPIRLCSSCLALRVSQASLSFCAILLTDPVPLGNDDWQCGVLPRLLSHLQRHLRGLQPSHQPLLDYGETAFRPHLLLAVSYYPSHRALAKV